MAKPRIFISSTFYDLKQVRTDLDNFIESLGYDPVRNEEGDIPYGRDEALEEYCYKEITSIDILVSIIGGRFGSESSRNNSSISQIELKTALRENKQVYIFIEKSVLSEYETYFLNKDNEQMKYKFADDKRIYQFIEEIKSLRANNIIKDFEIASDISKYLKEQFAGLFQRFLAEQTRMKEIGLIKSLEQTAHTLNQLVNFLSDENKGQAEEINKILMIHHPLVESIKNYLGIPYNIYFEKFSDVHNLLVARGFKRIVEAFGNTQEHQWTRNLKDKKYILRISTSLFEDDEKLKYLKKTEWREEFVHYEIIELDDDDIPF